MKRLILLAVAACAGCGDTPVAPPAPYFDLARAGVQGDGFDPAVQDLSGADGTGVDLALIDKVGPSITFVTPLGGAFITGIIKVELDISDPSGVDEKSVKVTLGASNNNPGVDVPMVKTGDSRYSGVVDTRLLTDDYVLPILAAAASDLTKLDGMPAPNHTEVAETLIIDRVGPALDLDPPAGMHVILVTAMKTTCSYPFDPVGEWAVNDGDVVQQLSTIRARIEDRGNTAPGQTIEYVSMIKASTVKLYIAPASYGALVVENDMDGERPPICDDIEPKLVPVQGRGGNVATEVPLDPLPPSGAARFVPFVEMSMDPVCSAFGLPLGDKEAMMGPPRICGNDMTYHMPVVLGGMLYPAIWSIGPVGNAPAPTCEGVQFDLANRGLPEGPLCAAVVAYDNGGNRNVSKPLRLCYDKGNGMCAAYGKRSPNYSFDHAYERMADFKNLPKCTDGCTPGVRRNVAINNGSRREDAFPSSVLVIRQ